MSLYLHQCIDDPTQYQDTPTYTHTQASVSNTISPVNVANGTTLSIKGRKGKTKTKTKEISIPNNQGRRKSTSDISVSTTTIEKSQRRRGTGRYVRRNERAKGPPSWLIIPNRIDTPNLTNSPRSVSCPTSFPAQSQPQPQSQQINPSPLYSSHGLITSLHPQPPFKSYTPSPTRESPISPSIQGHLKPISPPIDTSSSSLPILPFHQSSWSTPSSLAKQTSLTPPVLPSQTHQWSDTAHPTSSSTGPNETSSTYLSLDPLSQAIFEALTFPSSHLYTDPTILPADRCLGYTATAHYTPYPSTTTTTEAFPSAFLSFTSTYPYLHQIESETLPSTTTGTYSHDQSCPQPFPCFPLPTRSHIATSAQFSAIQEDSSIALPGVGIERRHSLPDDWVEVGYGHDTYQIHVDVVEPVQFIDPFSSQTYTHGREATTDVSLKYSDTYNSSFLTIPIPSPAFGLGANDQSALRYESPSYPSELIPRLFNHYHPLMTVSSEDMIGGGDSNQGIHISSLAQPYST